MHIETRGLSTDQEQEIAKRVEMFRHENRCGAAANSARSSEGRGPLPGEGFGDCDKAQTLGAPYANVVQTRPVVEDVTLDNVDDVMRYQPWNLEQLAAGDQVREALTAALRAILRVVPRCPTRDEVVRDLVNARMKANAAISFRGRF